MFTFFHSGSDPLFYNAHGKTRYHCTEIIAFTYIRHKKLCFDFGIHFYQNIIKDSVFMKSNKNFLMFLYESESLPKEK